MARPDGARRSGASPRGAAGRCCRSSGSPSGSAVLYASLATDAGIASAIDRTVRDLVGRADLRVEAFGPSGLSAGQPRRDRGGAGRRGRRAGARAADVPRARTVGAPDAAPPPVTVLGIDPDARGARSATCPRRGRRARRTRTRFQARSSRSAGTADGPAVGGSDHVPGRRRRAGRADGRQGSSPATARSSDRPGGRSSCRSGRCSGSSTTRPSAGSTSSPARARRPGEVGGGDRGRPDERPVRPLVAGRRRGLAPELDRGLPLDDRADRRGRAVRRGVSNTN